MTDARTPPPKTDLRSTNVKLAVLLVGQLVSLTGTVVNQVALPLLVIERFGVGLSVGIVLALRLVPRIVLGPFAGVLADRLPRRAVIAVLSLGITALVALIPETATMAQLYGLVLAIGVLDALMRPASFALLPEVFPREQLYRVNTAQEVLDSVASLAGPIIAVALVESAGIATVFRLDAASYLFGAATLLVLTPLPHAEPALEPAAQAARRVTGTARQAFDVLRHEPLLLLLFGVNAAYTVAIGALQTLYPVLALDHLGAGEWGYGLLATFAGIGGLIGVLVTPKIGPRLTPRLVLVLLAWSGLLLLALGLAGNIWVAAVLVGLALIPETLAYLVFTTESQRRIPRDRMGRFYGVVMTGIAAALPVGNFLGGIFADNVPPTTAVAITGGMLLVLVGSGTIVVSRRANRASAAARPD